MWAGFCLATNVARADDVTSLWQPHFREVGTPGYAYLTGVIATETFLEYGPLRRRLSPRVRGPWPGDEPVRDLVLINELGAVQTLDGLDDWLWWSTLAFPIYADAVAATWIRRGDPATAWQLTAISLQALLTVTLVSRTLHLTVRRQRPIYYYAEQDDVDIDAPVAESLSFPGGHAATTFAGAGLACAFHRYMPLFGGGLADAVVCPAILAVATSTAMVRVMIDRHYFSDTLVGAGIGFTVGYFFPQLFHFGGDAEQAFLVLPQLGGDSVGLRLLVAM